jgi:hypothetical protein
MWIKAVEDAHYRIICQILPADRIHVILLDIVNEVVYFIMMGRFDEEHIIHFIVLNKRKLASQPDAEDEDKGEDDGEIKVDSTRGIHLCTFKIMGKDSGN